MNNMKTLTIISLYRHDGYQGRISRLVYSVHPCEFPWRFPLIGYYPSPELAVLATDIPNARLFEIEVDPTDIIPPRLVREVELPTITVAQRIKFADLVANQSDSIDAYIWAMCAASEQSTYAATRAVQCAAHTLGHTLGGPMGAVPAITFQEEIKCIN